MTEVITAPTGVVKNEVTKVVTEIKQIPKSTETARVWSLWAVVISFILSAIAVIWYFFRLIDSQIKNVIVERQNERLVIVEHISDRSMTIDKPDFVNSTVHFAGYIAMSAICVIALCGVIRHRGRILVYVLVGLCLGTFLEIVCLIIGVIIQKNDSAKPQFLIVLFTILIIISYLVSIVCLFYYQRRIDPVLIGISENPPKIEVKELGHSQTDQPVPVTSPVESQTLTNP